MEPDNNNQHQDNLVQKRLSERRKAFDRYRLEKLVNNKTVTPSPDLQNALFKAAKVGNINLMIEFISHGANPFLIDENGYDAISYAMDADPIKTGNMLLKLISETMKCNEGGSDE